MTKVFCIFTLIIALENGACAQNSRNAWLIAALDNDTAGHKRYLQLEKDLALPLLTSAKTDSTYRFWCDKNTNNVVLNIAINGSNSFAGLVKLYCEGNAFAESQALWLKGPHIFYKDFSVRGDTLIRLLDLLRYLNSFLTENKIPNWNQIIVDDGWGIKLDCATPDEITHKHWHNPDSRSKLISAGREIDSIAANVLQLIRFEQYSTDFLRTLPRGSYSSGSVGWISAFKSKRELRRYHRLVRRREHATGTR